MPRERPASLTEGTPLYGAKACPQDPSITLRAEPDGT